MKIKRTDATFTSEWMNEWTTPAPTRWPPLGSTDVRVPTGDKRQTNWGDTTVMALKGLNGIHMLWLQPASLLFVSAATGVLLGDHSWKWWGNGGGGEVSYSRLTERHMVCFQLTQSSLSTAPFQAIGCLHLTRTTENGARLPSSQGWWSWQRRWHSGRHDTPQM